MFLSKRFVTAAALFIFVFLMVKTFGSHREYRFESVYATKTDSTGTDIYDILNLSELGLKKEVFTKAMKGWNNLIPKQHPDKPNLLSIADFSQSSNAKRFYVIDLEKKEVLFHTYVSHGRNSGAEFASSFGNKPECHKSSLGFYLTASVYKGDAGLSLRLKGLENGINDRAEQRGIVVHGARYVSESFIEKYGRLGRSQGCPVVPPSLCEPIVECIKDGSGFFIFYPDSNYFRRSEYYH